MKVQMNDRRWKTISWFIAKTLFYFCIFLVLIYLYHYKNVQGGTFIYNEF